MELSEEQKDILEIIQTKDLLKIEAASGSGKTFVLLQIANLFKGNKLYLAYNKAIAQEAKDKFDPSVEVKTTHALAWLPIIKLGYGMNGIKPGPRKLDFFNWRHIIEDIKYEEKLLAIDLMETYFTSKYISLSEFLIVYNVEDHISKVITSYVKKMANKDIPATFAFSLTYYHILLSRGVIKSKEYELIMLDEAGDLNEVTLEIFKLLPAKKKVMVGDTEQNIFSFNKTINGFKAMQDVGVTKTLTTSYRCSDEIAAKVEIFGKKHLKPAFRFKGLPIENKEVNSIMYIARTNSSLITKMIELNEANIPYSITRKAQEIFGLLLTMSGLKPGCTIYKQEYKFLLQDVNNYYSSESLRGSHKNIISYISSVHHEDINITSACRALGKYGSKKIWDTFNIAKVHEEAKTTHKLRLSTSHSSKGLECDKVILAEDMFPEYLVTNERNLSDEEIAEECRLLYVAVTRARHTLIGAGWLETI